MAWRKCVLMALPKGTEASADSFMRSAISDWPRSIFVWAFRSQEMGSTFEISASYPPEFAPHAEASDRPRSHSEEHTGPSYRIRTAVRLHVRPLLRHRPPRVRHPRRPHARHEDPRHEVPRRQRDPNGVRLGRAQAGGDHPPPPAVRPGQARRRLRPVRVQDGDHQREGRAHRQRGEQAPEHPRGDRLVQRRMARKTEGTLSPRPRTHRHPKPGTRARLRRRHQGSVEVHRPARPHRRGQESVPVQGRHPTQL